MKITGKQIMQCLGEKNLTEFVRRIFDPLKYSKDVFDWHILDKKRYEMMSGTLTGGNSTFRTWAEMIRNPVTYDNIKKQISFYQTDNEQQYQEFRALFESDRTEMDQRLAKKIEMKFTNKETSDAILLLLLWSIFRNNMNLLSFLYVEKADSQPVSAPAISAEPEIPSAVPLANINFCGYQKELQQAAGLLNEHRCLFIQGIGGIGKTQFAKTLLYRLKDRYQLISMTFESSICKMLIGASFQKEERHPQETDEAFARRILKYLIRHTSEKTLILVDNFDTQFDPMLEEFLSGPYSVIVTTRCSWSHLGTPVLILNGLEKTAQQELFCKHYGRPLSEQQAGHELPELLRLLCGHPLTIELIAGLMRRKHKTISDMIQILCEQGITPELGGNVPSGFGKAETVYEHIRKLFSLESLNQDELQIMKDMTLLPVKGTDLGRFSALSAPADSETIMQLFERSWVMYDETEDIVSLHPLICDVIIGECCKTMDDTKEFLRCFTDAIHDTWDMLLSDKQAYMDITLRILQRFPNVRSDMLLLYQNMSFLAMHMNYDQLKADLTAQCLSVVKSSEGDNSERAASNFYYVADDATYHGDFEKSITYIKLAIDIMQKISPYSLKTAYFLKYHAWILLNNPKPEILPTIRSLLEQTEQILNQKPDYSNTDTELFLFSIPSAKQDNLADTAWRVQKASLATAFAYYYFDTEQYEKALEYAELAYPEYLKLFGEINVDSVSPLTIKALILSKTGRGREAVDLMHHVIDIQKQIFPEKNQKLLLRYRTLAMIYYNIGDLQNAVEIIEDVFHGFEEKISPHNFFYQDTKAKLEQWSAELNKTS